MIVTIDGPAGAGKSSIARQLAAELNFDFLDTGAMYRAITLACLQNEIDLSSPDAIESCAAESEIKLCGDMIWLNDHEVSHLIRSSKVNQSIRAIADNIAVRQRLVHQQRQIVIGRDFVTEGRDQGTVAFPDAQCKFFLTASPKERAMRRHAQLVASGIDISIDEILAEQQKRDADDTSRVHGGLTAPSDSIFIHTDGMQEDDVVQRLVAIVAQHRTHVSS